MATITFKGNPVSTIGSLPAVGSVAPDFSLTRDDLSDTELVQFAGKVKILNIVPSLDTGVCAASARAFNKAAENLGSVVVLTISRDLPFAQKRFCAAEGLDNVLTGSEYRDSGFSRAYGVTITDGPLRGLFSRAVLVIDKEGRIVYAEQVPEISQEPDYEKALAAAARA